MKPWTVFGAAVFLTGILSAQDRKEIDKAAEAAIKEQSKNLTNPDASQRISAINALAQHKSDKVIAVIARYLTSDEDKVRIAAAQALGTIDHFNSAKALCDAVNPNIKNQQVIRAIVAAMVQVDWEICAETLNTLCKRVQEPNITPVMEAVCDALGKLGSPTSVDPLITVVDSAELEGSGGFTPGGGQKFGKNQFGGNPAIARLRDPAIKAIEAITTKRFNSATEAKTFWKKNSATWTAAAIIVFWCEQKWQRWEKGPQDTKAKCPYAEKSCGMDKPCKRKLHK
jgi:HEAT repeat protein